MRMSVLGVLLCSLAFAMAFEGAARAQGTLQRGQVGALTQRVTLGCVIDSRGYLSLRNTTSGVLRLGTPVYWTGKQLGQADAHQYSAPLYADVAPAGSYQIGGAYRYDPSVTCQLWIVRPAAATRAP